MTMAKSTKSLSFFCVIVVLSSFIVLVQCQFGRNRKQKSKVTESNVCQLEADPGQCSETIRKFYFDVRSGECKMFDWSGCDGNGNRFNSKRICEKKCRAEKGGVKRCPSLDCDARRSPCRFGRTMDANGCETCHCRTTPACPQDQCFIQCPFGYAEDEHGCRLCECLPPTCPPFSCRIDCQHGFKSDPLGCKICICEEGGAEEEKEKEKQEEVKHTCSPLICAMHCERGYVKDSHGCNVCQCVDGPQTMMTTAPRDRCGPRAMCAMHCPLGFQNDTEGCSVCRCIEAPPPPPPQATTARAPVDRCSLRPVCRMYCADGFVKDADGCDRCECLQRPPTPTPTPSPPPAVAATCTPISWFWCWKVCAHGYAKGPDGCDKCECHVPGEADEDEEESKTEREGWEVEPDPEPELSRRCSPVQCRMYCKHGFQTDDHGCEICKCRQVEEEERERERVPASCSPITCYMYCQHGFEKDERGCDRCRCAVPPSTTVPSPLLHRTPAVVDRCQSRRPACRMFCPYGYERDPVDGCDRCACFSPTDSVDYARARQATARCSSDRRCSTQCFERGGFKTDAYGCMLCECVDAEEEEKKTDSQAVDAVIADARKASCSLSPEVGPCRASRERWHYNPRARRCETFRYGGCRGNANNFLSEKSCIKYCKPEVNQEPTNNWKSRYFRMIGML